MRKESKRRNGALAMGLLLAVTIAAAGCERRQDTQVVDTPNGRTVTSTETVQVDRAQLERAKDEAKSAASQVGDQASAAARDASGKVADAALTTKVKARLATDSRVSASSIDVDTNGGVVTLNGTVASDAERKAAVDIASGTAGVSSVVDHLTVGSK